MTLRTLNSLGDLRGKKVLVRCDLNVPLDGAHITDDGRIRASLPTISRLRDAGARVIIISHLGRPEGTPEDRFSLAPAATRLGELLGESVVLAADTVGESARAATACMGDGDVVMLENVRFNAGETAKGQAEREVFAAELAALGDAFVSDGFGVVHRKQASVYELARDLPSAAGLLIEKELSVLERLTSSPDRPYTVVLGGSKVSDKLGVISHLLPRVDTILIGGGMLYTFLAAQGYSVGSSLLEVDQIETCRSYLAEAKELGVAIVLPEDIVVASRFSADADFVVVPADRIEETPFGHTGIGLDIGPAAAETFTAHIAASKTVFWNGPAGVFEMPAFANGTLRIATALANMSGFSVVGGGDSAAAVRTLGFADSDFGHIATGGGASLEFLEGKKLPGLEALGWQ
ncbi:MAG: phosphoglycerate kinase [Aurantimicrobium sp.]|nr:phosphoglycerate kinase [Aurantimicrobium sp.]